MIVGFMVLATLVAWRVSQSAPMGGVCLGVLFVASWRMWIPISFEFSSKGVSQSVFGWQRRVPWTQIARCEIRRQGVLLLADAELTPLSPLRGVFVRWNRQREEVLGAIDYFLARRRRISMSTTKTFEGERARD